MPSGLVFLKKQLVFASFRREVELRDTILKYGEHGLPCNLLSVLVRCHPDEVDSVAYLRFSLAFFIFNCQRGSHSNLVPNLVQAVRLSQELSQARECLADLSSRVSDSRQDSRHPADVVGSLSTSTSVAATSAAAAGAAPTTSAWDRYQPNIDARSQSRGLVEGLENALGGGLFSDIASESSVGASPAPPGGGAREASSTGRQERTPLRTREHGTATATAGGNDDAGSDSVAHGDRRGGRSDRVEHKEEDSVVFDLEDVRGFIRHEGQRLRERVRERQG